MQLLELSSPLQLVFARYRHVGRYSFLRSCDEARQIAPANVEFDTDPALSVFTANLRWSFLVLDIGELGQWNKVAFAVSHSEITDGVDRVALLLWKANLHGESPVAFDDFSYRLAADRRDRVQNI